ncbi:B3/4 domain-containing protein [Nonomuraea sp. NPDC050556]|uniref:B3/4 domain-containing protein n=1 Tax=Nonomuraea sp. NPDC050556 TaxID=3364369 RepID=UPI0037A60DB8
MRFSHAPEIWADFPTLAAGVVHARYTSVADRVDFYTARAFQGPEAELPEIQAWRRAFSQMGLKPTQYRCASESLLRRLRKEGVLPRVHPLVDLCNAISVAFAIPVAAIDVSRVAGSLEVRYAKGDETYQTFGGSLENPAPGEVIFADEKGQAHARRWTNRQSGLSAVSGSTSEVLIIAEGLHAGAASDVRRLVDTVVSELGGTATVLSADAPAFDW